MPVDPTNPDVRCERFREAVSARLDGEPIGTSPSALQAHLSACVDCARWEAEAVRLSRVGRVTAAEVPDLSDRITAAVALPAGRVLRRRRVLRLALLVAGLGQLAIAVPAITGDSIGMVMSAHAAHEAAAWNLALAAAFLATASRPRRAAGLVPLLATFVVVLSALGARDFASGAASAERLATHLIAVAGLVLLVLLDRAERALPPDRWTTAEGSADTQDGERPGLRGVA